MGSGGGSGSSGGGGSSGAVSYPAYMEALHSSLLSHAGADTITDSLVDIMNAGLGNSPWTGLTAYNPDADIAAYEAGLTAFSAILAGLSETTDWDTIYNQAKVTITPITEAVILADIAAFSNQVDDELLTKVLPRFRRGMQDINAVVSSAFPIGEAVIEAFRDRDVAKFSSGLRIALESKNSDLLISGSGQMMQMMLQRIGWEESYAKVLVEAKRMKIVAKKEQTDQDAKLDEEDALWDLELFQYGGNLLAGIGGGVSTPNTKQPGQAQSMIGGALSGGVAGGMIAGASQGAISGPWGMAIGAALGAGSALL